MHFKLQTWHFNSSRFCYIWEDLVDLVDLVIHLIWIYFGDKKDIEYK